MQILPKRPYHVPKLFTAGNFHGPREGIQPVQRHAWYRKSADEHILR